LIRIRSITLGLVIAIAATASVAVSGSSAKGRTAASAAVVSVRQTSLGRTLVDGQGRTLYLFEGDRPNASTLSQAGFAVWPAFTASRTPRATGGAIAAKIGTIVTHGKRQIVYNHHPLYYYVGDQKAGDTLGQALNQFGALWYVLSPAGNVVKTAPHSTAAAPSGYGY
jgi:predicted lipoprotein with Yx(FWY)xxD motif